MGDLKLKLLEENIGKMFQDIGMCKDFFKQDAKSTEIKAKRGKWDYIQLKNFYIPKKNYQ
jgi:hypothetical protein